MNSLMCAILLPLTIKSGGLLGADRKSTRLNSSHTVIYPLSLHDALPIWWRCQQGYEKMQIGNEQFDVCHTITADDKEWWSTRSRSEEHTSELQSHSDLPSFPTRRSSDLVEMSTGL